MTEEQTEVVAALTDVWKNYGDHMALFGLDLQGLAPFLEREVGVGIEFEPAARQVGGDGGGILPEQFGVYHRFLISASFSRILISSPRGTGS